MWKISKASAELDSKAHLSQKAKGFALLPMSARSSCDRDRT
ncbi:hypothetical protein [Microcoleus sp. bin38.metabat.b11b12b14.051]|nr:hypothetical protein [Microcoleus sp. bin38.metabat.b11b12b14.051]